MSENILGAILVGVIISVFGIFVSNVISVARYFMEKRGLEKALIEDLKHRIDNTNDYRDYFDALFVNHIKENEVLSYHAHFTKEIFPFYDDIRKDLFRYFTAQNLINIMRSYEALEDIEILTEGLCKDFTGFHEEGKILSADDIDYLEKKRKRIYSIIDILQSRKLRSIKDLPREYTGKQSATSIIRLPSH